jgi:poly(glycerol-phosphate) alpha-glucosyltransferase
MVENKLRVTFYSIVPSPYQRDLFYELSQCLAVNLQVNYLEAESPDSPWPAKPLQPYERILSGQDITWGNSRFHINYHWPHLTTTDVVVLNGYQNLTAQLILKTQARNVPCIFWGEKMVAAATGLKGQLQKTLATALNACHGIAAIGTLAQQDYQKRFPDKPVFNIPYYCDLTRFARSYPRENQPTITILFCGQMIARKGVDVLLHAFEKVIGAGYNARLLLVGREAELPEMLQRLPAAVRSHIEYAGFQAPDDLHTFFQQADLFVLPSRYDGWGVVVNQALGAGLPIICSETVGAAHDLITQGENGMTFPVGDVEVLYRHLQYYLNHPAALEKAGELSLRKAKLWSPKVGAQRWLEVLQQVVL